MWKFVLKRLIMGMFIVIMGAFVVYAVIRCLPSSYVETLARQRSQNPASNMNYDQWLAQLNQVYRLDRGIVEGFLGWLVDAFQGNFGNSWEYGIPVTQKFNQVIGYSVFLNVVTLFVQMFISIPLGIIAARKQYSKTDYAITFFAIAGISLPSFFLATILKYVFAVRLGWFDISGLAGRYHMQLSEFGKLLDIAHHMVLPIVVLTMLSIGGLMRYTRTNMLEVLNSDYIRTARAKGLPEKKVINKHAFRNTLIPLVTYMSYLLPSMFGGSMITETMFKMEGIGYVSYNAMYKGDIPFAMFYTVFIMILTQVSLIVADIMYAAVDPRVRIN